MAQLVSSRYAVALFELSLEENRPDEVYDEVIAVREAFTGNEQLIKIIGHPRITSQEKIALVERIFKGRVSDTLLGLLAIVIRKGRESEIIGIFDEFINKYRKYKAVTTAEVVSAVELTGEQLEHVRANLSKSLGKRVEINASVDGSLIGGIRIKVDGRLIDGSIKKQLDDMKKGLRSIRLA